MCFVYPGAYECTMYHVCSVISRYTPSSVTASSRSHVYPAAERSVICCFVHFAKKNCCCILYFQQVKVLFFYAVAHLIFNVSHRSIFSIILRAVYACFSTQWSILSVQNSETVEWQAEKASSGCRETETSSEAAESQGSRALRLRRTGHRGTELQSKRRIGSPQRRCVLKIATGEATSNCHHINVKC